LREPFSKWSRCCGPESISLWSPMISGSWPQMTRVICFAGPRPVAGGA
jgi:hypothetical protein